VKLAKNYIYGIVKEQATIYLISLHVFMTMREYIEMAVLRTGCSSQAGLKMPSYVQDTRTPITFTLQLLVCPQPF